MADEDLSKYHVRKPQLQELPSEQTRQSPTVGQIPTLGQGAPFVSDVERRRNITRRFRQLPWQIRNIGAPVQTAVRNIPIVGRQLSDTMSAAAGMTPGDETAIEGYRQENPTASFGARAAGGALPYLVGPTSIPGRMAYGALVEGSDALSEGQDPIVGGGIGALGGVAASLPGRTVTPRTQNAVAQEIIDRTAGAWNRVHEEFRTFRRSPDYQRELGQWMQRNLGRDRQGAANTNIPQNRREAILREQENFDNYYRMSRFREIMEGYPERHMPRRNIPLSSIPDYLRGFGAGVGGHLLGADPLLSGAAGWLYGPAARTARATTERLINTNTFNRWFNNQVLPPRAQNMLYGSLMGTGHAAGATPEELAPGVIPLEAILSQIGGQR